VGETSIGLQRTSYEKHVERPGLPEVGTREEPWLVSATVAGFVTPTIALYAGYTRGLEESGIAPDNAANRNQVLPAIRTQQMDAGVRWNLSPKLKLVAGLFEVEKPYLTTDERNVFTTVGQVRHRGVELSFNGSVHSDWNIVAGAVLMEPRVIGEAVDLGRVSRRPVGQTERLIRANLQYRPPAMQPLSLDLAVAHYGERIASRDGITAVPAYTLVDVGARYRMKLGQAPATLRLQAANITDAFAWAVLSSNTFGLMDGRRYSATLYVDF
jgi:iron complex outermembrane receptor protein